MLEKEIIDCIRIVQQFQYINWLRVEEEISKKKMWKYYLLKFLGDVGTANFIYHNSIFYFSVFKDRNRQYLIATIRIHRLEVAALSETELVRLAKKRFKAERLHNEKIREGVSYYDQILYT